jgi:hypothetical protein
VPVLLVESCELVKIIVANAIATFDRVQLLTSCAEVEALHECVSVCPCHLQSAKTEPNLTSVLIAKVGFQPSGGIILQMPYLLPSGPILRMYSIGSRNSSSVGRKVGASEIPNKRSVLGSSLGWPGCPLLGTCDMSRGSARLALSGIAWLLPDGGPFNVPGADIMGVFPLMPDALGMEFG